MSEEAVGTMYIKQAQRLEREGDFKLAERLYVIIDEPDLAINMYKKARQYDNMVRLVKSNRPDLLKETYLHLAQQQEMEGNLKVCGVGCGWLVGWVVIACPLFCCRARSRIT
jgi:intraflagellar transport protein 172